MCSLIHISGHLIPGGQRDNLRNGWQVFTILRHQNAIGDTPEKLKFLLQIMRELRPRRRDLVSMVKRYIEDNYEEAETIIDDVESHCDFTFPPRLVPPVGDDGNLGCSFRSRCFNCSCMCCCCDSCCCCVILSIFFLLMVVLSTLVWYTHIFLEVQDYRIKRPYVGPFAIAVFGFLALSFASCVGYLCLRQQNTQVSYHCLQLSTITVRAIEPFVMMAVGQHPCPLAQVVRRPRERWFVLAVPAALLVQALLLPPPHVAITRQITQTFLKPCLQNATLIKKARRSTMACTKPETPKRN